MLEDLVIPIETVRALLLAMEEYKFTSTTLHEIRTFTINQRPTKHAPDARESDAKIVKSKSKRSVKSARG